VDASESVQAAASLRAMVAAVDAGEVSADEAQRAYLAGAAAPALTDALERLDRGDADVLVAAKLDRVTRSVADFARLLERANTRKWRLRLLDLGVDTSTPAGEFVANAIANSAQHERRLIGQRTRGAWPRSEPPASG
jgi:DNA invertase Pin-like site-specific DNA recombinase